MRVSSNSVPHTLIDLAAWIAMEMELQIPQHSGMNLLVQIYGQMTQHNGLTVTETDLEITPLKMQLIQTFFLTTLQQLTIPIMMAIPIVLHSSIMVQTVVDYILMAVR